MSAGQRVLIIGGGWAGLSCALSLAERAVNATIEVYEAAPQLGGRARSLSWQVPGEILTVDNGQHMLVGAYRDTLGLLARIGADPEQQLARFPLTLKTNFGLQFRAAPLRAPWHLLAGGLSATGLSLADAISAARFAWTLWRNNFQFDNELTLSELIKQTGLSPLVAQRMLRPLCLATLNTPPELASANVFAAVLRDTLGAHRQASEFLVAKHGLSRLLPEHAERALRAAGVRVHLRSRITDLNDAAIKSASAVVLACSLRQAGMLSQTLGLDLAGHDIPTEAIATIYLYWAPSNALDEHAAFDALRPFEPMMLDDLAPNCPAQWFFSHGKTLGGGRMAALVISAFEVRTQNETSLGELCIAQLAHQLALHKPIAHKVIIEKRATFRAAAGTKRPENSALQEHDPRLILAGDYTVAEYPATLESAVRSGIAASELVLSQLTKPH